ncbi:CDP-alcohol phosphatidyltransferase family protein [Rhodopila globiformis]|uniref:CDP-alcohol phosphatidyltransferase family protein n=1 Tax=Rhodopila globiformis TaxID=1071 RepID=UPI001EFC99D1|nr:CDP-alcohol phosphatidyltransferase family protein [Rhodopila globiformis]
MPDGPTLSQDVTQAGTASIVNLPNIITFGRLCAVPLAFWMIIDHRIDQAFILFMVAGASDALDGWLARRYGGNAIGAMMDPVADKALLVTMYVTLAAVDILPAWVAILVVFRDVVIVGGVVILSVMGHAIVIRPLYISKVNTLAQLMLVAASLLQGGYGVGLPWLTTVLIWGVTLTTLASGAAYVWNTARGG